MTVAAALSERWRRSPPRPRSRLFRVDDETSVLALCHWQEDREARATVVLLHGLTGDADAGHMRGTACKLIAEGFNVVRLNMRNCGGTEELTPSLYHTGLVDDLRAVLLELGQADGLSRIYFGGFSMGGNVAL
ncbi:MAG: alpha/beta fold hydrolase, partial [Planctomycetota bacterium]|nr:alpha/beta fold hydrolase [Planctomycetota bacterium]